MPRTLRFSLVSGSLAAITAGCAAPAYAGVFSTVTTWFTAETAAMIASAAAVLVSGILGLVYTRAVRTFRETGEFLTALGMALEDNRLTRDELAQIIREGRDIFSVWR